MAKTSPIDGPTNRPWIFTECKGCVYNYAGLHYHIKPEDEHQRDLGSIAIVYGRGRENLANATLIVVDTANTSREEKSKEGLLEALKGIILTAIPAGNSEMEFEKRYDGKFLVNGNRLESALQAMAKAERPQDLINK